MSKRPVFFYSISQFSSARGRRMPVQDRCHECHCLLMFPEELLAQFVTCPRCGHGNKFQTHRNGKAAQGSVAVVELPPVQVAELPSPSATAPTPAETAVNGSNRAMDRSQ